MKKNLLLAVFACINLSVLAQTSGDYRSAGTGDWNVVGTWEIYTGASWIPASAAPSSTDGVITIQSPHVVTANSTITADQVTIASGATLDKSSSSFTIADGVGTDLTINGTLTVTSNLSGAGTLVVNGTMNWSGGNLSGSVTISALGTLNATQGTKIIAGTTTINGTMNITGDGIIDGGGLLVNNATINKTVVGSGPADINVNWSNAGTINILAGEILNTTNYPTRTFTNTGTINISSGAIFSNNGHYVHNAGTMAGAGIFNQAGSFMTLNAALTVPASIAFNYSGGTTSGAGTLTATNLAFSGGNIDGTGGLTLNGTTTWTGGTFSRTFAIAASDIINANQGTKIIAGTMTIDGTMNITGNGINDGGGLLINNGIINKTVVGSGQADINVSWTNTGTINIPAGEILNTTNYPTRTFTNTGTINISSGAIFSNNGHYVHNAGTMAGAGIFNQAGSFMTLNAALTVPASIAFNYSGGTTSGAGTLTATNLAFSGGNIDGTGGLTLNGTTTWTGGTFSRTFAIAASDIINANQGTKIIAGTMTINGTMNITGNGIIDGGGLLINNATINKTVVGSGQADINVNWSNAGTINILAGEILNTTNYPTRTFTNTGTINISSGAIFSNNGHYIHNAGTMAGTGIFNQAGSFMTLNAALTVPASITFNYSGGTTSGAGTLTATNLAFSGGNIGGAGGLTLNGTTTWTGGTFSRNFAIAASDIINANQGTKIIAATMTVNGTMNITGNGIVNGGGTLINNGTINKTVVGSSIATIDVPLTNSASGIIKGTGTLDFANTFTNNGTLAPGNSTGLLTISGTQPFSANSTLAIEVLNNSGPATGHDLLERNSSLILDGTITVTELAIMPLSSYVIINLTSGTISGTFATVNLPYGYTLIIFATSVILNKFSFPLPVSFISFNATKQGRVVSLNWTTDNEINASHFEIERSSDGRTYTNIGSIVSNNIPGIHQYQFTDQSPLQKTNYYRLKQVDIDARHVYSRTEKVDFSKLITVSVSPNPARNILLIEGAENYTEIRLINIQGIVVKHMKGAANLRVDIGNLPAGQYFLRLTGNFEAQTISFLKQ